MSIIILSYLIFFKPSDTEDKEEKIREEKRIPSKKKVKKERSNLGSKLPNELEKASPITDQKKKSKKLPGDIEENLIPVKQQFDNHVSINFC